MRATFTVAGAPVPLHQVTLRRTPDAAQLSAQIVGAWDFPVGAACVLSVDGAAVATGVVTESDPDSRMTRLTADVAAATGSGVYAPARVQVRAGDMARADLDFSVLPGDTLAGLSIVRVVSTMGANSPWFTEVGF